MLAILLLVTLPAPRARAIDPVTLAVLAPIALRMAESAKPYLVRGGINMLQGVYKIGKDVCHMVFYLPLGLGEMTIGAPFGGFRHGMVHSLKGGVIAPTRLLVHTLCLPLYAAGVKFNTL